MADIKTIHICELDGCIDSTIHRTLKDAVSTTYTQIELIPTECRGACRLKNRISVELTDGSMIEYAKEPYFANGKTILEIGNDPLKSIIEANIKR